MNLRGLLSVLALSLSLLCDLETEALFSVPSLRLVGNETIMAVPLAQDNTSRCASSNTVDVSNLFVCSVNNIGQ